MVAIDLANKTVRRLWVAEDHRAWGNTTTSSGSKTQGKDIKRHMLTAVSCE